MTRRDVSKLTNIQCENAFYSKTKQVVYHHNVFTAVF